MFAKKKIVIKEFDNTKLDSVVVKSPSDVKRAINRWEKKGFL
jgi:hypothetical protein